MTFGNLIGDEWREGGDVATNLNPSDTADVIGEFARADAADAQDAVAAARDALPAWSETPGFARFEILDRAGA